LRFCASSTEAHYQHDRAKRYQTILHCHLLDLAIRPRQRRRIIPAALSRAAPHFRCPLAIGASIEPARAGRIRALRGGRAQDWTDCAHELATRFDRHWTMPCQLGSRAHCATFNLTPAAGDAI